MRRRDLLAGSGLLLAGCAPSAKTPTTEETKKAPGLELKDFQPRSMLHVKETKVPQARFPVIDIHTHLTRAAKSENGVAVTEEIKYLGTPAELLPVMDRKNIKTLVRSE